MIISSLFAADRKSSWFRGSGRQTDYQQMKSGRRFRDRPIQIVRTLIHLTGQFVAPPELQTEESGGIFSFSEIALFKGFP